MKRRHFLTGLTATTLISTGSAVQAKQLSLNAISKYLNGLKTAKGEFTQVNPDRSLSKGIFYLHRPGRMRFEYAPPNASLVVAGGGQVAIFDKKSNSGPQQYPLAKTPLNLILRRNVNLSTSGMVRKHSYDGVSTSVVAQDPKHPDYGNLRLEFTSNPTRLRKWVVTDQAGKKTTVILGTLDKGMRFPPSLFSIVSIADKLGQN